MSLLRLLSRVAFICNICFMLALVLLWIKNPPGGEIISVIIVMGFVIAFFVNTLVNLWYAIRLLLRRPLTAFIPSWLLITNFIFLIPQLILLLK